MISFNAVARLKETQSCVVIFDGVLIPRVCLAHKHNMG